MDCAMTKKEERRWDEGVVSVPDQAKIDYSLVKRLESTELLETGGQLFVSLPKDKKAQSWG